MSDKSDSQLDAVEQVAALYCPVMCAGERTDLLMRPRRVKDGDVGCDAGRRWTHDPEGQVLGWECRAGAVWELLERGILIPRDEALAAQGALIEQAAQHTPVYSGHCSCGWHVTGDADWKEQWASHIRSLTTAPMQAALERHRFAPECCVAAFKEQVHALLQGQIDSLKAAIDRPKPEDYTQEQWAKSGAILKERYAEAIGCQWAIDKLPVNEAALEKVKAEARLEEHKTMCAGQCEDDSRITYCHRHADLTAEVERLRRATEKQT